IFLIGFMATGKTTLGRALADADSSLSFVDLDKAVEDSAGRSVADIFADSGEAAFRRLESEMLHSLALPGAVIACGGGTPCSGDNMDFMLRSGTVILLSAPVDRIVSRLLEAGRGRRPLVDRYIDSPDLLRGCVEEMLRKRDVHYRRAHHVFDASRLDDAAQIAESVDRFRAIFMDNNQN
ncbi:MAG: shikimate kinase, partial [Muribaculaceae bacterium]|nr:shikimate kinase [Muribaculaceae bacterium]